MRTKAALLPMVAAAGWGTAPSALGGQERAGGEEIVARFAAALDSPAPQLSAIGTESTRLADMIRVESATWAAAAACYYLVKTPERWR